MSNLTSLTLEKLIKEKNENRSFTAKELINDYLQKIEQRSDLNSFITVCSDYAKEKAIHSDSHPSGNLLEGIPIAIKDVILTNGIKTTCASRMLENFIPPYDASVVKKLNEAGAITIGKTNMDEFAMGSSNENSYFGKVKNPWNTTRVPGGSSGGSAACVAAELAPAALGTDTGGSIRQPASFCGVVGIKPTYGRVSRYGVIAFASSLDQVGVFTRTVKDAAILLEVLSGKDEFDSTSSSLPVPEFASSLASPDASQKRIQGMRIGIPKEYFIEGLQPEIKAAIDHVMHTYETLGAELVEISLPHTEAAVATYYIIAPAEASSNLARFDGIKYGLRSPDAKSLSEVYTLSRSEGFGKEVKRRIMIGSYVLSSGYYDAYYLTALKIRRLIHDDFVSAFSSKCDVILCPVAPTTAFKLDEKINNPLEMYLNDIFTIPVNLAGLPAMSVPCGFDKSKLPIGFQLIGKHWEEETLFTLGYAYETSCNWKENLF
jgi:aspartyl-tRNA(Asn)/glutamyl-tRNA(Gln) amidotransferase subunit A